MRKLLALAVILSAVSVAHAGTETFTLTGVGGASVGGYDVYPYYGSLNGGASFTVLCDDFTHDVTIGQSWPVNVTYLSSGNVSHTEFGNLRLYEEAFWLLGQLQAGQTNWGGTTGLQLAVWSLFSNSSALSSLISSNGYTKDVNSWLSTASADASTSLSAYQGDFILSPTGGDGQEQIFDPAVYHSVPEPSMLSILGSSLFFGGIVLRKRLLSHNHGHQSGEAQRASGSQTIAS